MAVHIELAERDEVREERSADGTVRRLRGPLSSRELVGAEAAQGPAEAGQSPNPRELGHVLRTAPGMTRCF